MMGRIPPPAEHFERIACYRCGGTDARPFVVAEDDLTGKPGRFSFVVCDRCGLAYQNPRLRLEHIGDYYDDEYIAHRKKADWGWLTPFYLRAMRRHDLAKLAIVDCYLDLNPASRTLDIGCGAGTFLAELKARHGLEAVGVDLKNLAHLPSMAGIDFRCGVLAEQALPAASFDLVTAWHYIEHDYDPPATLSRCRDLLAPDGRLVIEVPRLDSLSFRLYRERWPGLQAPQHTVLLDRAQLLAMVDEAGLQLVDYLPWGAFPPYFYLFAGLAFKFLKGRGLDLDRAILPYFVGQALASPLLAFSRHLNLAMQTVVCRRREAG